MERDLRTEETPRAPLAIARYSRIFEYFTRIAASARDYYANDPTAFLAAYIPNNSFVSYRSRSEISHVIRSRITRSVYDSAKDKYYKLSSARINFS